MLASATAMRSPRDLVESGSKPRLDRSYWLACLFDNNCIVLGEHHAAASISRNHVIALLRHLCLDPATLAAFGNGTCFASDQRLSALAGTFPAQKANHGFGRQTIRFFNNQSLWQPNAGRGRLNSIQTW